MQSLSTQTFAKRPSVPLIGNVAGSHLRVGVASARLNGQLPFLVETRAAGVTADLNSASGLQLHFVSLHNSNNLSPGELVFNDLNPSSTGFFLSQQRARFVGNFLSLREVQNILEEEKLSGDIANSRFRFVGVAASFARTKRSRDQAAISERMTLAVSGSASMLDTVVTDEAGDRVPTAGSCLYVSFDTKGRVDVKVASSRSAAQKKISQYIGKVVEVADLGRTSAQRRRLHANAGDGRSMVEISIE